MTLVDFQAMLATSEAAVVLAAAAAFVLGITLTKFGFKTVKGIFSKGA